MKVKHCRKCDDVLTDKNWWSGYRKKSYHICKTCERGYQREYNKTNPETQRRRRLRRAYGLEIEDYNRMYEEQKGVCAICSEQCIRKTLCVDHNHTTGKVRGLLCMKCNASIGQFNDNIELLDKAKEYLCKWTT